MRFQAVFSLCIALVHMSNLATTTTAATSNFGGGEMDRTALLAFKSNIKHDPQGVMSSWNNSLHFCEWQGITCGSRHRRVTILDLQSRGLVGTLSPYMGNLSFLKIMILSNNTLQGKIPLEIGGLFRLKTLWLSFNLLEGKFLEDLDSLSKLKNIGISENNFTGEIPLSIGNLTSLEILVAPYNKFGGSIPDVFHRMKNLTKIYLGANELSGTLPPSLHNLSSLTHLSLAENQLNGSLSPNFGLHFPKLQYFQIRDNYFTGPIPSSLSNASKLEYIEICTNNFVGNVDVDFRGFEHLTTVSINGNNLGTGGADDLKFVKSLLNCSNLEIMNADENGFGGAFPNSVRNLSKQITIIQFARNQISGRIPSWIGTLSNLSYLRMSDNQFIGPIPNNLGKLQKLNKMDLSNNGLSGNIPSSLGNLSSLTELYLGSNRFHGNIPSSIGNCTKLLVLSLVQNSLVGAIPKQLFDISDLAVLNLGENQLVGFLPSEVGTLKSLEELSVYENKLSGQIPSSLGRCMSLEILYMDGNSLRGSIPPSLSSLRGIEEIDLSRNNLSGTIPDYLERFSLNYLNLSFNDFEGKIPTKGVFANATEFSVIGNKRLCGGISELKMPRCPKLKAKKRNISSLAIILISIVCILLGVALVSSFIYIRFKNKRKEQSSGSIKTLWKVSYEMLLKATNNFSTANLIGVGSFGTVYKGILNHDEHVVAIKVLNLQRRGASKSFLAECEALRNIRHRNLVKIITSCSSVDFQQNDFKALVYEFMPNGSLEKWLLPIPESSINQDQLPILTLLQRINISIDVAHAIEYLHHHCEPTIVHCDLKPSNILLDSDMIAHVGDLGLAKFLQEFTTPNQSSSMGVRGTIGYAAPEYGLGSEVSTSGDVYSFGIMLLEMMTGKRPTDGVFEGGHNLHNFARIALPDRVMEIVNPILLSDDREDTTNDTRSPRQARNGNRREESLISMVKIGVACSMESPQDRMDIANVVRELHLAREILQPTAIRHQRQGGQ